MNGDDFRFLRLMLGAPLAVGAQSPISTIPEVDLSGVNIISGGGSFDGQRYLQDNVISTGLFADCKALKTIVLPASAISLERDALARCNALTSLTVPAAVQKLLPSAGCSSLESIDVSPANTAYASLDGVLFNSDVTEILWFPLGKTGEYVLPATVSVIGENAFYGTSITSLNIPPSVVKISRGAFAGSSLVDIILPDNLTNISEAMFRIVIPSLRCIWAVARSLSAITPSTAPSSRICICPPQYRRTLTPRLSIIVLFPYLRNVHCTCPLRARQSIETTANGDSLIISLNCKDSRNDR